MRKEILLAIILGCVLGGALAFGIWRINDFFTKKPSQSEADSENKPAKKTRSDFFLEIAEPKNQAATGNSNISIKGHASPHAIVAITTNDKSSLTTSDEAGDYLSEEELEGGINQIQVTGFDSNGKSLNKNLLVVYSTYFQNGDYGSSLIGTITDLSESTIQIKTLSGEIEQISVNSETTYANIIKDAREIDFEDLALGDFVAAIGSANGNNIVEAQRILVTATPSESTIRTIWGKVTTFSSSEFLIEDIGGNQWSIDAKGGTKVTTLVDNEFEKSKIGNLSEGDNIIVIGEFDKEELDADHIHLVSASATGKEE
jgi:hypothetical protein